MTSDDLAFPFGVEAPGPLGGQKVHKSVKFCIMAGTAMPRSYRGTGVSPVNDWSIANLL